MWFGTDHIHITVHQQYLYRPCYKLGRINEYPLQNTTLGSLNTNTDMDIGSIGLDSSGTVNMETWCINLTPGNP